MSARLGRRHQRILIYSHDSFGLGHLRRCRTIAHALVDHNPELTVLILSGSPIIGSFEFRPRVDFVRVPGVIKLQDGDYTSLGLDINIEETLAIRASIIHHTAKAFDPDLMIVDKEPWGLRGEVRGTLELLKARGVPLVLGLRDVLDEPTLLIPEWQRKQVLPALEELYDALWVFGLPELCQPLAGLGLPPTVLSKVVYTGYLRRDSPASAGPVPERPAEPYLLVTAGGGGDGDGMIDSVLRAYETAPDLLLLPAVIVCGPFMSHERRAEFMARGNALGRVTTLGFEPRLETLFNQAAAVVAMGGYNTFCEILSFDKPALIVPRVRPRQEQLIRAERAQALGLIRMLPEDLAGDPLTMAQALRALPNQPPPSSTPLPGLLEGLPEVNRLAGQALARTRTLTATRGPAQ